MVNLLGALTSQNLCQASDDRLYAGLAAQVSNWTSVLQTNEAAATAEAARFSQKKLSLLQLLHPGQLGQKFQVLHAFRNQA